MDIVNTAFDSCTEDSEILQFARMRRLAGPDLVSAASFLEQSQKVLSAISFYLLILDTFRWITGLVAIWKPINTLPPDHTSASVTMPTMFRSASRGFSDMSIFS